MTFLCIKIFVLDVAKAWPACVRHATRCLLPRAAPFPSFLLVSARSPSPTMTLAPLLPAPSPAVMS